MKEKLNKIMLFVIKYYWLISIALIILAYIIVTSSGFDKKSDDKASYGEFWCMGKNDTCKNKTYSAYDLYCHSCDPDDNNIEGDQR